MLFSSLEFLFLFLPVTILVYFTVPLAWRNIVLLIFSLIFYGWGEPVYILLMIFTIAVDYVCGWFTGKYRDSDPKKSRAWMIAAIVINLALLAFFKYTNLVIDTLRLIPALSGIKPLNITLPIGISFYTFQSLSYVIDVYRRDTPAQKSPFIFGTYVTLFPQLIAGPIVRYRDVEDELNSRECNITLIASGIRRTVKGLCKKVLLANTAGALWKMCYETPHDELTAVGAWLGIICFSFQIYFDFSGYSDMAIGMGRIFGFHFLENFNYPYIADSITDFWRRWHISLSSWFREYVYFPLGGSREGTLKTYRNLMIVWLLTGLWHGAAWNFVLWGVYYGVLLIIEKAFLGKRIAKLPAVFRHIYALFFVIFGWILFVFDGSVDALGLSAGFDYVKIMFGGGAGFISRGDVYELVRNAFILAVMVLACTPYPKKLYYRLYDRSKLAGITAAIFTVAAFVLCTAYLVDSSFNPFLYTRF